MTVTAWRIVKAKRASDAFSGEGPRRYGGRWNSPGTAMVYTAGTRSLAALEVLVHLNQAELSLSYVLIGVTFHSASVESLDRKLLPAGWQSSPAPRYLQEIGDDWAARQSSAVLKVPSAIIPDEACYLINPAHPYFPKIKFGKPEDFGFDPRLKNA